MLPKKGRRKIVVNDTLYHYIISGCISVVIRNSETGDIIKWWDDWKPKWKQSLTPKVIRKIIIQMSSSNNKKRRIFLD